jgi:hypothetical protein
MFKILLGLVAAGLGLVIFRMFLVKAGLARPRVKDERMSQLRKELDLLLWAPPILIGLGAAYVLITMLIGD